MNFSFLNTLNSKVGVSLGFAVLISLIFGIYQYRKNNPGPEKIRNLCSCVFSLEKPEEFCRNETGIHTQNVKISAQPPQVIFGSLSSTFVSERFGCTETVDSSLSTKNPN